jgi:hypothetical protein
VLKIIFSANPKNNSCQHHKITWVAAKLLFKHGESIKQRLGRNRIRTSSAACIIPDFQDQYILPQIRYRYRTSLKKNWQV